MAEKTFGQAFAEASKQGLKKFQWKGGWYTTERADKKSAQTKGGIDKADYKQKMANKNGTVTNRFVIKHDKNVGYYVWDKDLMRKIGKSFKTKEDAAKYMTSQDVKDKYEEGFMIDAGDAVATAAWKKINRKTPGFQPVDENKNFQGKDGNTRLYRERSTGRYLVTDNYGNIVGYSFDPAAKTADANWGGWIAYTGNKDDLAADWLNNYNYLIAQIKKDYSNKIVKASRKEQFMINSAQYYSKRRHSPKIIVPKQPFAQIQAIQSIKPQEAIQPISPYVGLDDRYRMYRVHNKIKI